MAAGVITFSIDGSDKRLSVKALQNFIQDILETVRSLERDFISAGLKVRWEVTKASMKSPFTIGVIPHVTGHFTGRSKPETVRKKMVDAFFKGAATIEKSTRQPQHFNEETLLGVKSLVTSAAKEGAKVMIVNSKQKIPLTEKTVKHVDKIVEQVRNYIDYATIEGRLETVSIRGGTSFVIFEDLTDYKIDCVVPEKHFDEWLILLGKRVAATGRVQYRDGKPKSMTIETVNRLRDQSELPQPQSMMPINITEGLSSEEHVRRIRNA